MDVMDAAKKGEPHPRVALAAKAVKKKEVKRLTHGMLYRKLGKSDLVVSEVALGTMTWGEQVTEEQAHAQLNMAVDEYGVNFIDTAELYPVPADPDTAGMSEKILGSWLKKRGNRKDLVIATKVTGYSDVLTWLRKDGGAVRLTAAQINEAVEGSLKRLGTDYIDLLQLHWPDRYLNLFGVDLYDRTVRPTVFSYHALSFPRTHPPTHLPIYTTPSTERTRGLCELRGATDGAQQAGQGGQGPAHWLEQ